jgi:hypothetical protein
LDELVLSRRVPANRDYSSLSGQFVTFARLSAHGPRPLADIPLPPAGDGQQLVVEPSIVRNAPATNPTLAVTDHPSERLTRTTSRRCWYRSFRAISSRSFWTRTSAASAQRSGSASIVRLIL